MHDIDFVPLLIITALAFAVPLVTVHVKIINVPIIVGEILCGIIIGRSGFDLIEAGPWLDFLSLFGFTFLMFLSGMEIDLSFLRRGAPRVCSGEGTEGESCHDPMVLGGKIFAATLLLSLAVSLVFRAFSLVGDPFFLALVLSTTSVGIVVPTIRELGLSGTLYGQDILLSSIVADFMTMLLITVYVAKVSTGLSPDLLLILLIFAVFIALYRFSRSLLKKPVTISFLKRPAMQRVELKTRAAFAIMILFIVLSQKFGIEIILGAFLAGFLISMLSAESDLKALHYKLNAVGYGFFIPLFFIMVGVRFNLKPLVENPGNLVMLPLFVAAAYLVKMLPCLFMRKHHRTKDTLAAGILLASRLTLIIAAADIGRALDIISPALYSTAILVAVITSTLSPILFYLIKGQRQLALEDSPG